MIRAGELSVSSEISEAQKTPLENPGSTLLIENTLFDVKEEVQTELF
jgi:hypothetical protein